MPRAAFRDAAMEASIAQFVLVLNAADALGAIVLMLFEHTSSWWNDQAAVWAVVDRAWEIFDVTAIGFAVVTPIVFLVWLRAAASNAQALSDLPLGHTPGSATRAWFIPITNLFEPYQVTREIEDASAPDGSRGASLVTVGWWLLFVGKGIFWGVATVVGVAAFLVMLVQSTAHVVAAVLAAMVVRRIQHDQRAKHRGTDAGALAETFA